MNKLLGACVLLAVGVGLGRMFDGGSPTAAAAVRPGGGADPSGNGDVNGDGTINVSDAVYLLEHLFRGGPAVEPIECPPVGGLPDTGQSKCYGFVGNQGSVPCDDPTACRGQDAAYNTGCPTEGRFVDNGDGTVSDSCTDLMWQKDTADVNADGQSTDQDRTLSWCNALVYCENLEFAGHDDWRLPNVRELESLADYGRFKPAIDPMFGTISSGYWSSTTYAANAFYAWIVNANAGGAALNVKTSTPQYVRAVRRGP